MYVPNGKEQGDQPWLTFAFACDKWSCVADKCLGVDSTLQLYCAHYELLAKKKDKDRRKGKGHRFCLGDKSYSIPCHADCFALDDLNFKMNCTSMTWKKQLKSSNFSKLC